MSEEQDANDRWIVRCEECGVVEFDVLEEQWLGNSTAATYYAGYHDGKHHGDADHQLSMAEKR